MKKFLSTACVFIILLNLVFFSFAYAAKESPAMPRRHGPVSFTFPKNSIVVYSQNKIDSRGLGATSVSSRGQKKKVTTLNFKSEKDASRAISKLRGQKDVISADYNAPVKALYTPTDSGFTKQWGLNNTGQDIGGGKGSGTAGADVRAVDAWDREVGATTTQTVGVIDTGIDATHPEFTGKVSGGYNYAGISVTSLPDEIEPWIFGSGASTQYYAQSLKGTGYDCTHVGLLLAKEGSPSSAITVSLRSSLTGSDLASYSISASEISSSGSYIYKQLNNTVNLENGTTYYIVARTNQSSGSNFYYLIDNSDGVDDYAEGEEFFSTNGGANWTSADDFFNGHYDMFFVTNPNANPRDDNGHGTHVSGIIAAAEGNLGSGVGINFNALIRPYKALDASGGGLTQWIASAVNDASSQGIKIVNMSIGTYYDSSTLRSAVSSAVSNGVLICAAVGNDYGTIINYPAGYPNVMGVGATDYNDARASFSNYNSSVDISAPGKHIFNTLPTYETTSHTGWGLAQNYDYLSGTSMATPFAAGAASLLKSKYPQLSRQNLYDRLIRTADDKGAAGRDNDYGYGRLNVDKALKSITPLDNSYYIPYLLDGGSWRGLVNITNTGAIAAESQMDLVKNSSLNGYKEWNFSANKKIAKYGSAIQGSNMSAGIRLNSTGELKGQIEQRHVTRGSLGLMTMGDSSSSGKTLFFPQVIGSSAWKSTLNLINTELNSASVKIMFYSASGKLLKTVSKTIPLLGTYNQYVSKTYGSSFNGWIKVTSNRDMAAMLNRRNSSLTTMAMSEGQTERSAKILYFPKVLDGDSWKSTISLVNPNSTTATFYLYFRKTDGSRHSKTLKLALKPRQRLTIYPRRTTGKKINGTLTVNSNKPLYGLYNERDRYSRMAGAMSATPSSKSGNNLIFPSVVDNSTHYRSYLGLYNPTSSNVKTKVRFYSSDGTLKKTVSVTVKARSRSYKSFRKLYGSSFVGWVKVESPSKITGFLTERGIGNYSIGLTQIEG